jgi:hypothetical protein
LIPGPKETEEAFCKRVQALKNFYESQESSIASHHWHWASEQLRALFDFTPRWCAAFYSSKGLAPWQAAAIWIKPPTVNGPLERKCTPFRSGLAERLAEEESSPGEERSFNVKPFYLIQIRESKWVSWLIDRDELLAHEAAHAARMAFNEPRTEELFAYLTSTAKWRQVIGPIFSRPMESLLLMGILGMGAVLQMVESIWDISIFSEACFFMAAAMGLAWALRLLRMRARVARAARHLIPFLREPTKVRAVLFRMTDEEINHLSRGQPILEKDELRWRLIKTVYFK